MQPGLQTAVANEFEYGRVADVVRLFGLGKSTTYALLKSGRIRGVSLTVKGKRSRLRLVNLASVREFIESEGNQQQKGNAI